MVKLLFSNDIATVMVLGMWFLSLGLVAGGSTYNVLDYKAVGDGRSNDTNAFLQTWAATCADASNPTFLIPYGKAFLISETHFWGPCKSSIHVQLLGDIVAPNAFWTNELTDLLAFHNVNGLTMDGTGQIDGRGQIWWDCFAQQKCQIRPNTLAFLGCNNLNLSGIKVKNSPGKQVTLYMCVGVHVEGLTITAPGDSPNTDGILIAGCQHVSVTGSTIGTGDDCIAIGNGTSDVNITYVACGPGHGFSIGSLGGDGTQSAVEQVRVSYCNVSQALTGVRIKTWQGGMGYARGIVFEHVNFDSVKMPIVIDQSYCPAGHCQNKSTSVAISDVHFVELRGSSSTNMAINLLCSKNVPCQGIVMQNVTLNWPGGSTPPESVCYNAMASTFDHVNPPVQCLWG